MGHMILALLIPLSTSHDHVYVLHKFSHNNVKDVNITQYALLMLLLFGSS